MGALSGLRVIDLSPNRVGAQISQLFADFGAEVIWVEPPSGSKLREQAAFPFWARGKQSTVLDLHDEADRDRLRQLSADADVFIDTFRVGVLDRLGLGYEALAALNPRLVYTSVTGFGSVGPYVQVQGYEGLVAAKLGVFQAFHRMAPTIHPPFVSVPWCSFSASQVALHGTLAALLERETSGLGQRVETSLAQAFSSLDTWAWFDHLIETKWPDAFKRTATFDADGVPTSPFTFFATAGTIHNVGATPVFVDIDPKTFNIRPDLAAAAVTSRTKAVIPVDLFGQMAAIEEVRRLLPTMPIIEDAAQSIGARRTIDGQWRMAGEAATIGTFSFFP